LRLTPVFAEAQEQFRGPALRVVHFVHYAGHTPRDPCNRSHCDAPLFSPTASGRSSSIAVRPLAPNRTNALISCPAPALGGPAREQAVAGRSHTLTVSDQRSVLARCASPPTWLDRCTLKRQLHAVVVAHRAVILRAGAPRRERSLVPSPRGASTGYRRAACAAHPRSPRHGRQGAAHLATRPEHPVLAGASVGHALRLVVRPEPGDLSPSVNWTALPGVSAEPPFGSCCWGQAVQPGRAASVARTASSLATRIWVICAGTRRAR
jgi:hypothetical protein